MPSGDELSYLEGIPYWQRWGVLGVVLTVILAVVGYWFSGKYSKETERIIINEIETFLTSSAAI